MDMASLQAHGEISSNILLPWARTSLVCYYSVSFSLSFLFLSPLLSVSPYLLLLRSFSLPPSVPPSSSSSLVARSLAQRSSATLSVLLSFLVTI